MDRSAGAERRYAFFDVDGTIVNTKSVLSFLEFLRERLDLDRSDWFRGYYAALHRKLADGEPREDVNRYYYTLYEGFPVALVERLGREWFAQVDGRPGFYNGLALDRLRAHRRDGLSIALVTGSFRAILAPLAEKLRAAALLCAPLEVERGMFTGRLAGSPCIGAGKAEAIRRFAERERLELSHCFGYGDDPTDLPMLGLLGHPMLLRSGRLGADGTAGEWRSAAHDHV